MDVELYVYDLSRGLARQHSRALTGVQIDAIYHTAIVLGGVEYFFGQGIHRKLPGSTHHGRPIKVVRMGRTELPVDVIHEYIQSLEAIYTPESYDLFLHNCNNFSQDLAIFLVGESIPEEIKNLPETFLKTPIGQMLRGQIDQSMRQMTQAPDAVAGQTATSPPQAASLTPVPTTSKNGVMANGNPSIPSSASNGSLSVLVEHKPAVFINASTVVEKPGHVHYINNTTELDRLLGAAESSCAVIFFTSASCPPCKIVYPAYDQLAEEAGSRATLIKVDTSKAYDVGVRYQIRATPTFITFLKGKKDQEWSGAHEARLQGNVRLLVQMAHPQHTHTRLRLPSLQQKIEIPIMYTRTPPLEKLLAKIGDKAQEAPAQGLLTYLRKREKEGIAQTALPDLHGFSNWLVESFDQIPPESHFAIVDLVRVAAADTRVSGFLVAEPDLKALNVLLPGHEDKASFASTDFSTAPYNLQAVTLQLACNLFGSIVTQENICDTSSPLRSKLEKVAADCLLAKHSNARSLAAALVYNLAAIDHNERMDGRSDRVDMSSMSDLEAALVEAVISETDNKETLHSLLMALGSLLYAAPPQSAIWDLCNAMEVQDVLKTKSKVSVFSREPLLKELGEELLAKGGVS